MPTVPGPLVYPDSGLVIPSRALDHFLVCGSAFGQSLENTEALCIYGSMFGNLASLWLPGPAHSLCLRNFTGPCGLPKPAAVGRDGVRRHHADIPPPPAPAAPQVPAARS